MSTYTPNPRNLNPNGLTMEDLHVDRVGGNVITSMGPCVREGRLRVNLHNTTKAYWVFLLPDILLLARKPLSANADSYRVEGIPLESVLARDAPQKGTRTLELVRLDEMALVRLTCDDELGKRQWLAALHDVSLQLAAEQQVCML